VTQPPSGDAPPVDEPVSTPTPVEEHEASPVDKPPPEVTTGMGKDVDGILNRSKTFRQDLADLQAKGWTIKEGKPGGGTFCDRFSKPPQIVVDPNMKSTPNDMADALAHEVGHAKFQPRPPVPMGELSREEYIAQNLSLRLDDEGAATFEEAKIMHELRLNGGPDDFRLPGPQTAVYMGIYGDYYMGRIDAETAAHRMGQQYADGEHTSTTGQSYRDYYSRDLAAQWDRAHVPILD
jgi:type VI secretion system secreted protein VgrG